MRKKPFKISLPQFAWYGDSKFEVTFPPQWEVITCHMLGHDSKRVKKKEIQIAFENPVGTPKISQLAQGKREAVIIFDDLSRPTKTAELVPFVLQELKEGGIGEEHIRFVAALGAHGAMKGMDFRKKLGKEVVQRFPVYNHNPYENCTYLGTTSRGTPVSINSEVMSCDLKIAIGCIVPHPTAGFGGGGKIVIGVSHVDTIYGNHHTVGGRGQPTPENPLGKLHPSLGLGKVEGNILRADVEEIARMAGIDCIINVVVNLRRETIGVFVGDLVAAHREGVDLAKKIYATPSQGGFDVVVANAYCKANEGSLVLSSVFPILKEAGGDMVVICNTPEGQICHYVARSFGKTIGGRLWGPRTTLPPRIIRMITYAPYIDRAGLDWLGPPNSIIQAKSWSEVLDFLKEKNGKGTRVAVIPDATIQYFPDN